MLKRQKSFHPGLKKGKTHKISMEQVDQREDINIVGVTNLLAAQMEELIER